MKLAAYKLIAKSVAADLEQVFAKHGLKLQPFGARIDERGGVVKMSLTLRDTNHKDAAGNTTNPEREAFKMYAELYNLKPEWLGQEFNFGRDTYVVEGMKPRKKKSVVIRRKSDGAMRIAEPDLVIGAFTTSSLIARYGS